MANRLSNENLRKALLEYGEDVGPITPSTRSPWERRLVALRRGKSPLQPKTSALNAFSSDDSEIESAATSIARNKKRTHLRHSSFGEKMSLNRPPRELNNSNSDNLIFKKPAAISIAPLSQEKRTLSRTPNTGGRRKVKKKNSAFDVETSDSDFDSEGGSRSPQESRRRTPNFSDFQGVSLRRLNDDSSTSYSSIFQRNSLLNSSWATKSADHNLSHLSPTLERYKRDHSSNVSYQPNGYLSSGALSNGGDFPVDEKMARDGASTVTNYSHCVSWLLLLGVVIFFVVIGVVYMTEVQKTTQSADKSSYSTFCTKVPEELCKSLISICRDLHYLLTTVAGDFECGSAKSRSLSVPEARETVKELLSVDRNFKMEHFDFLFNHSISLFKKNSDLGVRCHPAVSPSAEEEGSSALLSRDVYSQSCDTVSALEATQAAKSLWCRVRLSFAWTLTKLILLFCVGLFVFASYLAGNFLKKRKEAQEKVFYEMVENVIDILQGSTDSLQQIDSLPGCCKAVVNVRDALIPAKEKKRKLWLWDRVVAFIEENESRVSVEYRKINGEDFKVWRWNPCTTSEGEGSKQGKVWQGQAFSNLGKGKSAVYTPSPCLKIRNMFDPEVEYGDDWQVSVRDAILEKCEGNDGILHIAFDSATNNEGCVFMLCKSSEAAGKAYNDLHGWWFDGKLVTVKYLKLSRYLERFPDAEQCVEPLKPSNNKRLSLSTPFFSSALERS